MKFSPLTRLLKTWSERTPSGRRPRKTTRSRRLSLEHLETRIAPAVAELVRDINLTTDDSSPRNLVEINGTVFFFADDGVNNVELWKSDGTEAGTVLVKNISNIVSGGADPANLTNVNGTLFFTANTTATGIELWKSDGTEAGTVLVKDINPGISGGSGLSSSPRNLTNVNGTLFFSANDGVSGSELWKSDGTEAGTVLVKDINPGINDGAVGILTNVNGTLFFRARDSGSNVELWKSDGTAAGTVLVKDINPGATGGLASALTILANVDGTLYFSANDGVSGLELWKSDGTAAGTVLVRDIRAGALDSPPSSLTNVNGMLYFTVNDGVTGVELWKSDGTAAGTVLVKDISPGSTSSAPSSLTNVNGTLFFSATDGVNGVELWKSDGSAAGTVLVTDINPGSTSSAPGSLTKVNGTLYFSATDGVNGVELWKSDGTAAGTVLVRDIQPGSLGSSPAVLTLAQGAGGLFIFFSANDGVSSAELWKSDGTAAGTVLVKDINTLDFSSSPTAMTNVNGTLFFRATDGVNGVELWKSDGTAGGTTLVRDIFPAGGSSSPANLTNVNGTLFFSATDGVNGFELWKSDGTAAGTVLVKNIRPGNLSSSPASLTNVNGTLYFSADDGANGVELWKSDGTEAGTVLVKNISPTASSSPANLTNANGTLFFAANDGVNGVELWKSDGTADGTVLVKNISPTANSSPANLTNVNGTLFFAANDGTNGVELWKSDGSADGTVLVKNINPTANSSPANLTNVNGTLFFSATDGVNGVELWKSDGSADGTVLIKDIFAGSSASGPGNLTKVEGTLFFTADDGVSGLELWKSDGTAPGTILVRSIVPGRNIFSSSGPANLTAVNGTLFFSVDDGVIGNELWQSDGTAAGTFFVRDIRPGLNSSSPTNLTNVNGTLFFSAGSIFSPVSSQTDIELWRVTAGQSTPAAPTAVFSAPLSLVEGMLNVPLLASASTDPNQASGSLLYEWDLDEDGIFGEIGPAAANGFEIGLQTLLRNAASLDGTNPPGTLLIALRVTDDTGLTSIATKSLTITNSAPTNSSFGGPITGVRAQPRSFTFTFTDGSAADHAAGFVYTIDWGDGTVQTIPRTPGNGALQTVNHAFTQTGTLTVRLTATDKDGGVSEAVTRTITISAAALQIDPINPAATALVVGGTPGNDVILLLPQGTGVQATVNGQVLGTFTPTGRVIAYGGAGNDIIVAVTLPPNPLPAWLFGDSGDDALIGGYGNDVLVGGDGNDSMMGDSGRDLLIGGVGADAIVGFFDDDILVTGSTAFDTNLTALGSIQAEWTSDRDVATRRENLRGTGTGPRANGSTFLQTTGPSATVFDDGEVDSLADMWGHDWIFANLNGEGTRDVLAAISMDAILEQLGLIS